MWKIVFLTFFGFLLTVDGSKLLAFDTKEVVAAHECVLKQRETFKLMQKTKTIKVNGKFIDYTKISLNDSSSSSAVINLSVSRSMAQLSMLNISYTNLLLLDVSFTGLESISDIGNETFPSLRLFNLSHNSLSNVRSHLFHHLKELEILDLSYNCFASFHYNEVFLRHENLKKLLLNDNRLYRIQSTFREPKLMTLDFLDFSNNFVSEFSNYDFQIKRLNMQNNSLISVSIFHAAEMTLNAENNHLVHFYAPRGNFLVLNLSNNKFQYLSYIEIEEASVLDLSHNEISTWSEDGEDSSEDYQSFEYIFDEMMLSELMNMNERNLIRTKFVNLAHNKISSIEQLHALRNSLEINLEGNLLVNVSPSSVKAMFPNLRRVIVADNNLTKIDVENLRKYNAEHSNSLQLNFQLLPSLKTTTRIPFHPLLPPIMIPTLAPLLPLFPLMTTTTTRTTTRKRIDQLTTTTSLPPTSSTPQIKSATAASSVTVQPTTESDETASMRTVIEPQQHSSRIWLFASIFVTLVVLSLGFCYYRESKVPRLDYRNFNEVENFL